MWLRGAVALASTSARKPEITMITSGLMMILIAVIVAPRLSNIWPHPTPDIYCGSQKGA
jgi:hypothetical protein